MSRLTDRIRHLPREARDTLFLLAVIGWTVLPHVSHLPVWCSLLTGGVLLWRAWLATTNGPLPNRWVIVAMLVTASGFAWWQYGTLLGKEAGVTMAVALMALKTLELRARRDAFVVFFLGFFLVLTHFLYSQSLPVAVAMLGSVWGLLTALVLAHMPVGQPNLKQAAALSARTALLGVPIMALLFLLFPRVGPLWGVPSDGMSSTGLSNSMRMGSVTELAQDDRVALRLRFKGAAPAPESLYLRGPVLSEFDGVEWRPPPPRTGPLPRLQMTLRERSRPIDYEMTLEPLRLATVPTLEATPQAPVIEGYRLVTRDDLQWSADRPVTDRLRFDAVAYARYRYGVDSDELALRRYVELPPSYNPRTLAWAAALRSEPRLAQADAQALAAAVMQHIRTGGFSYTLSPGGYDANPRAAIDEFWLDRKLGFCEHFAAAFVVVMRAMDVPARVVTGYQGADLEPVDGYYVVRQSSAHAWAEYWQPGIGWTRADPTAAVAPERIFRSRRLVAPQGVMAGALGTMSPALLAQFRDGWEAMNNRWNQWVLNYSRTQQLDLMKSLGFQSPSWEDLALMLIGLLSTGALAGALWAWWDRHRVDPWTRQMLAIRASLREIGIDSRDHEPPRMLAHRLRSSTIDKGIDQVEGLARLLETLDRQRFSRESSPRPDAKLTRDFRAGARLLKSASR